MDNPTWVKAVRQNRMVSKEINGVMVNVQWTLHDSNAKVFSAFPLFGTDVTRSTSKVPDRVAFEDDKFNIMRRYTRR